MDVPITLIVIVMTILTMAAFSFTVRGLLGVNFSLARLVMAGIVVLLVGQPVNTALISQDLREDGGTFPVLWFSLLGTFISILAGMVFLVVAEALVPSNTLPGPIYTIRASRRLVGRAARYLQIFGIIVRYGLGAYLRGGRRAELNTSEGRAALARSLRLALNEGGVTFVKLGQILSTRHDLLPPEFIDELSQLQDETDQIPWEQVQLVLRQELGGRDVDEVFAEIDPKPLAAASIAQVHVARLRTGEDVVVKIRRPGITAQVERDLDIVWRLANMVQQRTDWGRNMGATDIANGFAAALREELDLRVEARNIAVVAAAERRSNPDSRLYIPKVYPEYSTSRVLVMERIVGIPLGRGGEAIIERGLDTSVLARSLLTSLLRQIIVDGTFHADPHPGNVMLLDNNRLTLLDFGSVGRIDSVLRGALVRLLLAFNHADPIAATDALLDLAERPENLNEWRLERSLGQFMALYMAPGTDPDVRMFTDIFAIIARHGLAMPPEVAAVFRSIATLQGTLTRIDPNFDIVGEARAFASAYLGQQLRPRAVGKSLMEEIVELLPLLRQMPRRLDRISAALEEGRLSVNIRPLANEHDRQTVSSMLHEALLTVLASTAGVMAVMLIGAEGGPAITESVSMYQFIGYTLLVFAFILAMRVLVLIFRLSRP